MLILNITGSHQQWAEESYQVLSSISKVDWEFRGKPSRGVGAVTTCWTHTVKGTTLGFIEAVSRVYGLFPDTHRLKTYS